MRKRHTKRTFHGEPHTIRVQDEAWKRLLELAALQSVISGGYVSASDLVRLAVHFTFFDEERTRECFRRDKARTNSIRATLKRKQMQKLWAKKKAATEGSQQPHSERI